MELEPHIGGKGHKPFFFLFIQRKIKDEHATTAIKGKRGHKKATASLYVEEGKTTCFVLLFLCMLYRSVWVVYTVNWCGRANMHGTHLLEWMEKEKLWRDNDKRQSRAPPFACFSKTITKRSLSPGLAHLLKTKLSSSWFEESLIQIISSSKDPGQRKQPV